MAEVFVSVAAGARLFPDGEVCLTFEDKDLREIAVQLPLNNLRQLLHDLDSKSKASQSPPTEPGQDPLPLGGKYQVVGLQTGRTPNGVHLTVHLDSATGHREIVVDLDPSKAAGLADDLLDKASPVPKR